MILAEACAVSPRKIQAVILDWAGTAVDYGSFAPVDVMRRVFADAGIALTDEEVRAPMGKLKIDHIRSLFALEKVREEWRRGTGGEADDAAVMSIYERIEPALMDIIPSYAEPVPGLVRTIEELRSRAIHIGSTTGYTAAMMDILAPLAEQKGYAPEVIIASDEVPQGRPAPWMCFRNLERMGVYPAADCIKVGDTLVDIAEGRNAGMISVGVVFGSSLLGLRAEEVDALSAAERESRAAEAVSRYISAGADFVIADISGLAPLVDRIERGACS
jgi:phosphonoacetaldehyde hydrolase